TAAAAVAAVGSPIGRAGRGLARLGGGSTAALSVAGVRVRRPGLRGSLSGGRAASAAGSVARLLFLRCLGRGCPRHVRALFALGSCSIALPGLLEHGFAQLSIALSLRC